MSKLGKLQAKILVDRTQPHYGPGDEVTGTITLIYLPYSSVFKKNVATADLFGPLKLDVILTGRIRLRIRRERSHALPTNHDVALFASKFAVQRGSFEPEVGKEYKYPFKASFPRTNETLPPSFSLLFHDVPDIVDVAVQYRLAVDVQMPGIAIEMVNNRLEAQAQIRYEIAQTSIASIERSRDVFQLRTKIQNQYLLPEDQQPQGFKGKARAIFTSSDNFPTFVLDVFCTDQRRIYPGQQFKFEITLRRDDSETTAPAVPDITLDSFKAELKGITRVDGSQRLIGPPISYDKSGLQTMVCQNSFPISLSKANDYSTLISTDQLLRHASSFNHPKLARTYILKITMTLTVAKKTTKLVRDCPVVVVPPPRDLHDSPLAGSSRGAAQAHDEEVLPSYEEAPAYESADSTQEGSTKLAPMVRAATLESSAADHLESSAADDLESSDADHPFTRLDSTVKHCKGFAMCEFIRLYIRFDLV